jgi:hypothetical protein
MKTHTAILPSGIEIEVSPFMGEDKKDLNGGKNGMEKLLARRIVRLGEDKNLTETKIKRMGSADRAYAVFLIRQATFEFPETLEFEHTFSIEAFGKIHKRKKEVSIDLNEQNFGLKPYGFYADWLKEQGYDFANPEERVPMYSSYEDVLQHFSFVVKLPNDGRNVKLHLLDGEKEHKFATVKNADIDLALKMRDPRIWEESKTEGKEGNFYPILLDRITGYDISYMYQEVFKREGDFDISIKLEYNEGDVPSKTETISIFQPSFFSPRRVQTS